MNKASIIETTDATFELDVLQRSQIEPVVVDFWADWCQPCKALAPLLSQMAEEFAGSVTVVKAETEQCQQAASEFGVSGIPAIFGVADGAIVDGLQGAVSEDVLRMFFRRMVAIGDLQRAKSLELSDPAEAQKTYLTMLEEDAENMPAKVGLGRVALAAGDVAQATRILEDLESRGFLEPEAEQLKSRMALAADVPSGNLEDLQRQLAAEPENLTLTIQIARKHAANGDFQAALDEAIKVVEKDKADHRDQARLLMIDIFRTLPDDSPLTSVFRRQLAMALY